MVRLMCSAGLVADVEATGYVSRPLDWAPTPDHALRGYFTKTDILANLEAVIADQQGDGCWPITWPAVSPGCELEWRGWTAC